MSDPDLEQPPTDLIGQALKGGFVMTEGWTPSGVAARLWPEDVVRVEKKKVERESLAVKEIGAGHAITDVFGVFALPVKWIDPREWREALRIRKAYEIRRRSHLS